VSSARSKVSVRFFLTLSCLQVVDKTELPANCEDQSQEDKLSVSLSNFLEGAKVFCFVPLGQGYLVRASSWVPVWNDGQVSCFS